MGVDDEKISRIPGETLSIKVSAEEEAYRKKYLPDAKKLTDEKLVCTVCSVSLAQTIHKGKDLYIHRALQVLVCEACYKFYGDGCFSADEDGDDKYCRWCGQGGTLFLCSACNCAFCQKCTKQNLKASVLAELENDDWKCYICNPRPLFGCRTICWGAQQLNKIGKEKEQERLRKVKERLEKLEARKKETNERRSRKVSSSEDETTKKRKRNSDGDSSSPEVIPKRNRRESRGKPERRSLNGSVGRRRKDSSSDSEAEENKRTTRRSRNRNNKEKIVLSSSDNDSDSKSKKDKLKKKKKSKNDSDDSSEDEKRKSKKHVKKGDSSNESSEDEKVKKKKKISLKKRDDSTDDSSEERKKKKKLKKKKGATSDDESPSDSKKRNRKVSKKKPKSSSDITSDEEESSNNHKVTKKKPGKENTKQSVDSDNELKKKKAATESETTNHGSAEDVLVKKRIKLAMLWLSTVVQDISELGTLISLRATNFSKKKINTENLKSYEDVLNCVGKIKQLISGVHSNYDHIEKTLDSHLKPWKILAGLEEGESEKNEGASNMSVDGDVSKTDNSSPALENQNSTQNAEESKVKNVTEKNDWSDNSDDQDETRAMISKVNESLDKSQTEEVNGENFEEDGKSDKSNDMKDKGDSICLTPNKNASEVHADEKNKSFDSINVADLDSNNKERLKVDTAEKEVSNDEKSDEIMGEEDGKADKELKSEGHKEKSHLQTDCGAVGRQLDSSDDDSQFNSFTSRLKSKWLSEKQTDVMNLKQSPELVLEKNKGDKLTSEEEKNNLTSEKNKEDKDTSRMAKSVTKSKHRTKASEKQSFLSSSEEEEDSKVNVKKEEVVPKIVLKKLKNEEGFECEETKSSKIKENKSATNENSQVKLKDKGKEIEGCSDSEEDKCKKGSKKKTVNQSKNKITEKSNCLTSSDDEDEKQNSKTKKKSSSKQEDEKKSKEDKLKGSKEKEEKKRVRKIKENNKKKKTEDEITGSNSEEDDKVKNKEKKSKDKGISEKNMKEDKTSDKVELSDDEMESKKSRKSKLKKYSSDEEKSTKNKKMKLKKMKENKDSKRKENSKESKDSSEDDEYEKVENGDKSESERSNDGNQEKSVSLPVDEDVDESKVELENEIDFTLELKASSTESTTDVVMVQEKEKEAELDLMETNSEEKEADMKDENETEEAKEDTKVKAEPKNNVEKRKFIGLSSSSDEDVKVNKVEKKESPKKRPVRNKQKPRNVLVLSSDDEEMEKLEEPTTIESSEEDEDDKDKKDGDFSVVVESSADSSDAEIIAKNKRKKKTSSDSDASFSDEIKKKKKRRRVKCADSSDESGGSDGENAGSQKNAEGESPAKGGRKNIKKIKKKGDLEQTTIEAAEEEKERRRRIEERQKLFNQVFEIKESAKLEKLVLDFDPETKKELISVNKDLVAKMKPHQAKGVKFMWDSCFESVKQVKKTKGSGCILAHCMGLGKTFQVISLVHTLLTHEELTKVRTVMVVCPLSTVLNWVNEFGKWLEGVEGSDDIEVFHLTKYNKNPDRARELRRWQHNGGVLVMGYEMFRNLTNETTKKFKAKLKKDFLETLIDPGADLIVCDEGHMLKNEATALSKAMTRVKTLRRIVLTGTPMQNNLKEYHCMVQFVKPNLLGTSKEFLNRFVNPINNGQFVDSTDHDVKLMKRRAHVLHKMLEGLVQRFDYNVLTPFLPPKQEYVISVCLSELQEKLYSYYLENESQKAEGMKGGARLFLDWQTLGRVWTHPRVLKLSTDKANWLKEKKAMEASDSEGSLKDFIDDDSEKSTTTEESSDDFSSDESGKNKKKKTVHRSKSTRSTRQSSNVALLESSDEENRGNGEDPEEAANQGAWWSSFVEPHHFEDMRQSGKLLLLFAILKECELIEDKVLVFSQSLFSLDLIEYFLDKIDAATQEGRLDETLDNHQGNWSKGLDYFRLDGSTSSENRNIWCKAFNREDNPRARLFLISTRAGGLGINLTAANRVIIFDASWNPSHDIQSIFRIYRFGQKKPCYVYRFVAYGTMEEKVYERQVAKQSISNRVVDEQQVHRHFSMNDLTELYTFTPASKLDERPTPALPRDPLMAEILSQMKAWIEKYHEHDSLLENVVEEELNEEERKAAWEDYENDKKRGFLPPAGPQGPSMNPNAAWNQQIEVMRQQLKLRYPTKSDDEINQVLVYQVSIMMRQQQQMQMQMQQAANNMGFRPQMYGNNMMGMFNQRPQMQTTSYLRNIAPKPSSQQPNYSAEQLYRMQQQATQMRLQMQQQQQQQKAQAQAGKSLQSLLTNYPTANLGAAVNARTATELQRMKMNYEASRQAQAKPGVVITEITDDKPSGSSES